MSSVRMYAAEPLFGSLKDTPKSKAEAKMDVLGVHEIVKWLTLEFENYYPNNKFVWGELETYFEVLVKEEKLFNTLKKFMSEVLSASNKSKPRLVWKLNEKQVNLTILYKSEELMSSADMDKFRRGFLKSNVSLETGHLKMNLLMNLN